MVARELVVTGHVQGVFFRDSVRQCAEANNVSGWAANEADGSVRVRLEGADDAVRTVETYCHQGPSSARVDDVQALGAEPEGLSGFETR